MSEVFESSKMNEYIYTSNIFKPVIRYYLDEGAYAPERAHALDAGLDLRSPTSILFFHSVTIDTGVHVIIPEGYCGLLVSKSGLNVRNSITSTGLIDSGYTGSIKVKLYNHADDPYEIKQGDKISQLVILPCDTSELKEMTAEEFNAIETERGDNGFGSTGR